MKLLGGYAGYGAPDPNERNIALYKTTLSGDIPGDNSYHVVTSLDNTPGTIIDGFTICWGRADQYNDATGAGILVYGTGVAIIRCTIHDNTAHYPPHTQGTGGGIACRAQSGPGGDPPGPPMIVDCVFFNNWAREGGGALYIGSFVSASVINSLFYDNSSGGRAGAVYSAGDSGHMSYVNCTFAGNTCAWDPPPSGGALYFSTSAEAELENCILWATARTRSPSLRARRSQ